MTKAQRFTLILAFAFSIVAHANLSPEVSYYPADFYSDVNNGKLHDKALRDRLFDILSQGHMKGGTKDQLVANCRAGDNTCSQRITLGYTLARQIMFGEIHLRNTPNGYAILDVYCQQLTTQRDYKTHPPGPNQIPDSAVMNAEHTWPQSHFNKAFDNELQKSDLNILYPVLSKANSSRSNLHFSDVNTIKSQPCGASKRGYTTDGTKQEFFEVPAVHKGNVARAIFYFSVRYKSAIPAEEEANLRRWNHDDPPDDFERQRNETVYLRQHDRNPFIDYPELADLIADFN